MQHEFIAEMKIISFVMTIDQKSHLASRTSVHLVKSLLRPIYTYAAPAWSGEKLRNVKFATYYLYNVSHLLREY